MNELSLGGLFLSAFISATIAPGGSEAVLAYLVHSGNYIMAELIIIATIGNVLGALTTWYLGQFTAKNYAPESVLSTKKHRSIAWVRQYGYWALLFSWLPIIGDGLCFAGGWLKLALIPAMIAITIGKASRYLAIAYWFS
jgi:membrane protein YqaA with SNARE-associated domain